MKEKILQKTTQITLDDLALMVKKGFDANDKRMDNFALSLESLENGLGACNKRIDTLALTMKNGFERLEAKFDNLDTVVRDHSVRIKRIERRIQIA